MSKFTFVCQDVPPIFPTLHSSVLTKRTVEFESDTLDSVIQEFEMFLRGCGYYFDGNLEIVNDDEENTGDIPAND